MGYPRAQILNQRSDEDPVPEDSNDVAELLLYEQETSDTLTAGSVEPDRSEDPDQVDPQIESAAIPSVAGRT